MKILIVILGLLMTFKVFAGEEFINICSKGLVGKAIVRALNEKSCRSVSAERMSWLKDLKIEDEDLVEIPNDAFEGLTSLTELWINNTQLSAIPTKAFKYLPLLQTLGLDGNNITLIPDNAFADLKSLKYLVLHNTQISSISDYAFSRNFT